MINLDDNINGKFIEILGRKGSPLALISLIFILDLGSKVLVLLIIFGNKDAKCPSFPIPNKHISKGNLKLLSL